MLNRLFYSLICLLLFLVPVQNQAQSTESAGNTTGIRWQHYSSAKGDLPVPNAGKQQTAAIVTDIDKDGINDFVITERTLAPSVVWYRKNKNGWSRYLLEANALHIEAGATHYDVDGDGDEDIICGGDFMSNEVWWWENPYPTFQTEKPWVRHAIKKSGSNKHHDQLVGDFDGDGTAELVCWNQSAQNLFLAKIPENPKQAEAWDLQIIYYYNTDSQMEQLGQDRYPAWKGVNEHEGLAKADIDSDGIEDIVGGGRWFKYDGKGGYLENIIDASYTFTRSAAGQFIAGGRPEIILIVGDGKAPMRLYEWQKGTWKGKTIADELNNGHTLEIIDFNHDGHMDIFSAEMGFEQGNPEAKIRILLGDGNGNFTETVVAKGFGVHEGKIADLDGDGDYDILGKPYAWQTPRLDIWINEGPLK